MYPALKEWSHLEKTMVHAKNIASVMPFFDSQSGAFEFRQASSPPRETACRVVPTKPTHKTFTVEIGRGINLAFFFQSEAAFLAIVELKSLMCVLFAAFWSKNLLFAYFLQHFGAKIANVGC